MSIEETLFENVSAMNLTISLPILFANRTFPNDVKPADNRYIHVSVIPNDPNAYDWGGEVINELGLLQLNVYWTPNVGIVQPSKLAREIAEYFKINTVINDELMSYRPPSVGQWLDKENFIPVRVFYRSI